MIDTVKNAQPEQQGSDVYELSIFFNISNRLNTLHGRTQPQRSVLQHKQWTSGEDTVFLTAPIIESGLTRCESSGSV